MTERCELFRELLPWHAARSLEPEEESRLEAHLEECAQCRAEMGQTLQVAGAVRGALSELPGPGTEVWQRISSRIQAQPLARVDVGTFMLGISLWLVVRGRQVLLGGDLRLLGRKYQLFAEEA